MEDSSHHPLIQCELQLSAVEESLKHASEDQKPDLLDLKEKLIEAITLLQASQKVNNQIETSNVNDEEEVDEFLRFQMEIKQLEEKEVSNSCNNKDEPDTAYCELYKVLSSLEGNKCRAPFYQQWGEKAYHNAIIFSTDLEEQATCDLSDVQVKVMFCNPRNEQMKPCPFFLDGYCKFSEDKCRYSHGFTVKFSEIEEYVLPDYSNVARDSKCLAKYEDGLWYSAVVETCLDDHKYFVKYDKFKNIATLAAHEILPIDDWDLSDSDSDDSSASLIEDVPFQAELPSQNEYKICEMSSSPLGSWEQHTKGIGSKLMAKMGYITGQGLGKNSDGRLEPVEAVILPKGKSLDKCAELRERFGPVFLEEKCNVEQAKEEKKVKRMEDGQGTEDSFFEFINKNISNKNVFEKRQELSRKRPSTSFQSTENKFHGKELNFEIFSVGENIKKVKREISRLQQSLDRNATRNEAACIQIKHKMAAQNNILKRLEAQEQKISGEMTALKNHKKIAIF